MECCAAAAEVSLMMAHYRPNKLAADISLALFRLLTLLPAGLAQLLTYEVMDFLTNCPTESRGRPRVQIALYNKNWTRPLKKKNLDKRQAGSIFVRLAPLATIHAADPLLVRAVKLRWLHTPSARSNC